MEEYFTFTSKIQLDFKLLYTHNNKKNKMKKTIKKNNNMFVEWQEEYILE